MSAKSTYKRFAVAAMLVLSVALTVIFAVSAKGEGVSVAAVENGDIFEIAGKPLSDSETSAIIDGFDTKAQAESLGAAGELSVAREIILYKDYGGTARVVYNFSEKEYFVVDAEFYSAYVTDDNFRRLGAPVTAKGTYVLSGRSNAETITAGSYTAQIFEKGMLIKNGTEVKMYVGAVEKNAAAYILHPVIDDQDIQQYSGNSLNDFGNVDSRMHPLKEVDFLSEGSDDSLVYKLYANYRSCCVYVEYNADYSIITQLVNTARNYFVEEGKYVTKILPSDCFSVNDFICDGNDPVDSDALSYYQSVQANGTKESLIGLFASCYNEMLADGFVAGYRCSTIKMWSFLVLDLKFGDGKTGFSETGSGDRERMTCMVYNPAQNRVYPVNNTFFMMFKEDEGMGRNALGYPESKAMANKTIGGVTYSEIQIFKNGYIYKSELGNYIGVTGYGYDAEDNCFIPMAVPNVSDRYGAEIARSVKDGVTYINYEKGAIKCELTLNKSKYNYTYYNGRNFDFNDADYKTSLLDMDSLFTLNQLVPTGDMPKDANNNVVSFDNVIKPALYEKYTELYEKGFFCGFVEEEFKGSWNGVFAQQFVVGDSTAMIFGEERPNVSALVYNPKTGKVYLMRDEGIRVWQDVYKTAHAPTSDEYQVAGCDFWFQTFDFGMTIRSGSLVIFTEVFDSPEEYVREMKDNPLEFPTHGKDQSQGYIG